MFKKFFAAFIFAVIMMCSASVFAAVQAGNTAYVKPGSMTVYSKPTVNSKSVGVVYNGEIVTVLEAYSNGKSRSDNYHKIQMSDGTVGYVYAYGNGETLEDTAEADKKTARPADDKYQHDINMSFLSNYLYGGSKSTEGEEYVVYKNLPSEWRPHKRPKSLPLVGRAVIHVGDEGKITNVKAYFTPGTSSVNYHERRLKELKEIGYDPVFNNKSAGNFAFLCTTTSEFEVVAYNEQWVAVWSTGAVDLSRGMGAICGASTGIMYASWKPGVYFFPRKYCYILDINNTLSEEPEIAAMGKATGTTIIKTSPDKDDYVKSGVYKVNQSFPIVDSTPVNGHYKVYYRYGIYYVETQYVNLKELNIKKPAIAYTAEVNTNGAKTVNITYADGTQAGVAKNGAALDIIEKGDTNCKIWFNSKECYIATANLTDFQKTASGSGVAALGAPIGSLVLDSPWSGNGQVAYTAEGLETLRACNYGMDYYALKNSLNDLYASGQAVLMEDRDWANVYKIEDFWYAPDPDYPDEQEHLQIYTVLYGGNIRYIVQNVEQYMTFTYYPGNGYSKETVSKTQALDVNGTEYNVLAYNINGNNYFKLRDIAKMLSGTPKTFDLEYDEATNSIDMLSFFNYTEVGGELATGDGVTRTARASSAFLTYDGIPIQATCYNINGNNYFKLRDITDALDARVEWNEKTRTISINTSVPAYDDPNEPVG